MKQAGFERMRFLGVAAVMLLLPTMGHAAPPAVLPVDPMPPTAAAATPPADLSSDLVEVMLDNAKVIRLPQRVQTIVVGNPIIADVTMLKNNGLVVVTGKGFGETNMIFLDKSGAAIQEASVRVVANHAQLTVQRGLDRESYSCRPRCEPTVSLGDADTFIKDASSQIQSRNSLAAPVSH